MALTRRGRREGSIYRTADGRWRGEVVLGRRPDGRRDRRVVYGETRQEVAEKLAALVADYRAGRLPTYDPTSVGAYLDSWLATRQRMGAKGGAGVRPNTAKVLEAVIRLHIKPAIGHIPLQKLTADDLERLYRSIIDPPPAGKGLSIRMAEIAHRTLHAALEAAVRKGKLAVNPCDRVPDPPRTRYRAADRPRLDRSLVPKVLDAIRDTRYYLPLLVAMTTGLRRGEVLGLTWENVDLERGVLRVRQQWALTKYVVGPDGSRSREWGLAPVKTQAGVRDVPIPPDTVAALAAHLVAQKAQFGERWTPQTFVFDRGDGKPIYPHDLDHAWAKVRETLKLPSNLHLHDLRGSYITWLAEQKVDPKAVAEVVGHADVRTVWELYQSVTDRMRREVAEALSGLTRPNGVQGPNVGSGGTAGGNPQPVTGGSHAAKPAS